MKINEVRKLIRLLILESDGTVGYKMIFLAGLPGGGKSTLLRQLGLEGQFTNCNIDNFFEPQLEPNLGTKNLHDIKIKFDEWKKIRTNKIKDGIEMTDEENEEWLKWSGLNSKERSLFAKSMGAFNRQIGEVCEIGANFIIDGTATNTKSTKKKAEKFKAMGYDVAMIYVDIDPETSKERNIQRGKEGGRAIWTGVIDKQSKTIEEQGNINVYQEYFGDNFFLVSNRDTFEAYQEAIELIRPGVQAFMEG